MLFGTSHCLRLEVSSPNFPAFDRHPKASVPIVDAGPADSRGATQTVLSGGAHPSRLVLPVLAA